jgi:hypothetical protein
MRTKFYAKLVVLLCIVAAGISCKKDKKTEPDAAAPVTVSAINGDVMPLSIAMMNMSNSSLQQQSYNGKFGGKDVAIGVKDSILAFVVPADMGEGEHELTFEADGKNYAVKYKVLPAEQIQDAGQYIANQRLQTEHSQAELNLMYTEAAGLPMGSELQKNITALAQIYSELDNKIASASEEDKKKIAQFYAANQSFFSDDGLRSTEAETLRELAIYLYQANAKASTFLAGGVATMIASASLGPLALIVGAAIAAKGVKMFYKNNINVMQLTLNVLLPKGDMILSDQQKSSGIGEFSKNVLYNLRFSCSYRKLDKTDISSPDGQLIEVVTGMNEFESLWNSFVNLLPNIISSSLSVGQSFHLKHVQPSGEIWKTTNTDKLSISNISNSSVSSQINKNGEWFQVKFNTSANTDQQFSYDVAYSSPELTFTETFYGTLITEIDSTDIYKAGVPGTWMTTWYDNTNNSFYQEDKFILYADGTGKRISSKNNQGNISDYTPHWGSDPFYDLVWEVVYTNGIYTFRYWDERWNVVVGGRIIYPVYQCNGATTSFNTVTVKQ